MDTIEFIRHMFVASHRQVEAAMKDMTAGQFNWVPTGTANPISATYIHSLSRKISSCRPSYRVNLACGKKTAMRKRQAL